MPTLAVHSNAYLSPARPAGPVRSTASRPIAPRVRRATRTSLVSPPERVARLAAVMQIPASAYSARTPPPTYTIPQCAGAVISPATPSFHRGRYFSVPAPRHIAGRRRQGAETGSALLLTLYVDTWPWRQKPCRVWANSCRSPEHNPVDSSRPVSANSGRSRTVWRTGRINPHPTSCQLDIIVLCRAWA